MATVKTAISIDKKLFKKVEALSNELDLSRSQVFAQAVEYLIHRREDLELLKKLNAAYQSADSDSNLSAVKTKYSETVKDKW